MVREYDYRSGGWGFISPKVLLDESFPLNVEIMSSTLNLCLSGLVDMHGILSPDSSGSNLAGGSVPHAYFLACKT